MDQQEITATTVADVEAELQNHPGSRQVMVRDPVTRTLYPARMAIVPAGNGQGDVLEFYSI
jgi:hypothetical protein